MIDTVAGELGIMTAYEIATLAARNAALWVAIAQVAVTAIIGGGQIAVVLHGIRAMQRMGERRAREQDQRHAEAMQAGEKRHAEAMAALNALIEGQARQGRALDAQTRALNELIERTAPRAGQ